MYLVVSRWDCLPGKAEEFKSRGVAVRSVMRSQPGVVLIEGIRTADGGAVVVHGYADEAAYNRIVNDENGPFMTAIRESGIEDVAQWVWSERGTAEND